MSKKTYILILCVICVCIMLGISVQYAVNADVLPTSVPIEETIISQDELSATRTAQAVLFPTATFSPSPTYYDYPYPIGTEIPTIEPYPAPQIDEEATLGVLHEQTEIFGKRVIEPNFKINGREIYPY